MLISVSVTTVLVAAGVSAAVSLAVLGVVLLVRALSGPKEAPEARVSDLVDDLALRMEAMGRDLSEALEQTGLAIFSAATPSLWIPPEISM